MLFSRERVVSRVHAVTASEQRMVDSFADDRSAGTVIGSRGPSGVVRCGVDVEGRISIDHNAVRLAPLLHPGWGRQGLSYGPFSREPGLAFAVCMLNGHNASQAGHIGETLRNRLRR